STAWTCRETPPCRRESGYVAWMGRSDTHCGSYPEGHGRHVPQHATFARSPRRARRTAPSVYRESTSIERRRSSCREAHDSPGFHESVVRSRCWRRGDRPDLSIALRPPDVSAAILGSSPTFGSPAVTPFHRPRGDVPPIVDQIRLPRVWRNR